MPAQLHKVEAADQRQVLVHQDLERRRSFVAYSYALMPEDAPHAALRRLVRVQQADAVRRLDEQLEAQCKPNTALPRPLRSASIRSRPPGLAGSSRPLHDAQQPLSAANGCHPPARGKAASDLHTTSDPNTSTSSARVRPEFHKYFSSDPGGVSSM